jgi:hypothetical protein
MELHRANPQKPSTETENSRSIQEHSAESISEGIAKATMPLLDVEPKRRGNAGGTPHTLVRDPQLRKQIRILKQTKVLQWLKTEIYSSPEISSVITSKAANDDHFKTGQRS